MLRIPRAVYEEALAHCRREYPKEACGILAGRGEVAEQVYRMTNIDASPISYQMDPKEQLRVMKQMRQANQTMLAIYHSHTASAAYPSPVDVTLAVYPEAAYVLIALRKDIVCLVRRPALARCLARSFGWVFRLFGIKPEIRGYHIIDRRITEDNLRIEG